MRRIFLFFVLILTVLAIQTAFTQETAVQKGAAMKNPIWGCENLIEKGLHKDAFDLLRPWLLEPKNEQQRTDKDVPRGIGMACDALRALNRLDELPEFLEKAEAVHAENWRAMHRIAMIYVNDFPDHGTIVDGKLQFGWNYDGRWVNLSERNRTRALIMLAESIPTVLKDEDKTETSGFFRDMAKVLLDNRMGNEAWRLQSLTDLSTRPDYKEYLDEFHNDFGGSSAPVDGDGNPVLYGLPESFEAARNDGERWRWCLAKSVEINPSCEARTLEERAEFSRSQFGEETLREFSFFGRRVDRAEDTERTAGIWSLESLPDNEAIAKLAGGVKRFELPDEFHYIALTRKILEVGNARQKNDAKDFLARVYLDRCQFDRAAEIYRDLTESDGASNHWKSQLAQITGNWGRFEPTGSKVVGVDAELRYTFRNGKKVKFTAHEIRIPTLLADIKTYLKGKPQRLDWSRTQIEQVGRRLLFDHGNGEKAESVRKKYLGEKAAEWSIDLQPAEKHFDRQTTISVPVQKPGAYFVKAEMENGNTQHIVLWLNDTVIVRKQLDGAQLYFVADATSGQPVAGAKLDFFGYRMEWKQTQQPGNRKRQAPTPEWFFEEFQKTVDADGLSILSKNENLNNFNWLVTTGGERSAFLGFSNIWFNDRHDERYNAVKAFVITDRPVYRPKDTVQIKAWVGTAKYDKPDENEWAGKTVSYEIHDPRGEKIDEKSDVQLDAYGGFTTSLELPKDATLGVYNITFNGFIEGGGRFRVEEYKKPEYEVTVDAPKEPVRLGDKIEAKITAKYYFGSPVTEATVRYTVKREKHDAEWFPWRPWDWFYGPGYGWLAYDTPWLPGWLRWGVSRPAPFWFPRSSGPPEVVAEQEVKIGEDGTVDVEIDTSLAEAMFPGESQKYSITAEVVDNSRRTVVGTGTVLVSKEPFKVYAWVDRGYYEPNQKIEANFQARRLDGKPVSGDAEVKIYRISYKEPDTQRSAASGFEAQETEVHTATVKFDAEGKATLSLNAGIPSPDIIGATVGQFRISCKLGGQEGGYVFNVYNRPIGLAEHGGGLSIPGETSWKFNTLELLPEKAEYTPGENVTLRINSDRENAFVLLFVKPSNGVALPPQVVRLQNKSQTVAIPVEAKDMPNFFVEALLVSNGEVINEMREIAVPPRKRILNVNVKPSAETYKPGVPAKVDLIVTDLAGTPAVGQIVVSIYDKSVEYISGGSNVDDIKEFFWKWRRHHHPGAASSFIASSFGMDEPNKPGMQRLGIFGDILMAMERNKGRGGGGGMRGGINVGGEMLIMAEVDMEAAPMAAAVPMMKSNGAISAGTADFTELVDLIEAVVSPDLVEPTVRKNFADTALWVGALETDKDGRATVELDMPESLTTWKINVWSMGTGTRVGHGTAEVITRKDLIIRMQTPRFLIEKDQCVFSANVHNYLANDKEVKVSLDLKSPMRSEAELGGDSRDNPEAALRCASGSLEQTVKIPAGGEARVDWTVEAQSAGEATVVMKALTDEDSDAMQLTLPVYVHGMMKQEAWSGYVAPDKESGSVEIKVPEERKPEQTKLTVRFSPTLAASMIDALPYLVDYPYGCTEQTLNRFLPTVLVQKILVDMNVDLDKLNATKTNLNAQELGEGRKPAIARKVEPVYDVEQVREMVADGVTKLTNMQCTDGGWGWFGGYGERSSAHLTALVVHGLRLAQKNDVEVDEDVIRHGIAWLTNYQKEQNQLLFNASLTDEAKKKTRWKSHADETDAFVFMVLAGEQPLDGMMNMNLWTSRAKLSLYGVAMYGIALSHSEDKSDVEKIETCVKMLEQYLVQDEENQTAHLNLAGYSRWSWWCWHGSEFETQGYYLKLLMRTDPKSPVAPRLVKYLLNNRRHATYWNSTRDTAIVIEAFAEFLRTTGEDKPEMSVEVLVDGEVKKTVEITPENLFEIDNTLVLEGNAVTTGTHKIELRKKGKGPLYFNAYLENFTLEDPIEKAGLEVKVERRIYKLVRDESAKTQAAGGHGQVLDLNVEKYKRILLVNDQRPTGAGLDDERKLDTPGRLVPGDLVEIELVIESKNDYESIIIEDMKAAGLEPVDVRSGYNGNELGAYVEFRDERVAFFVYRLAKGKHSVSYRLRAEQPGSFSALPAKIEAMYAPELKGNSDENKVKIEDR